MDLERVEVLGFFFLEQKNPGGLVFFEGFFGTKNTCWLVACFFFLKGTKNSSGGIFFLETFSSSVFFLVFLKRLHL